MYAYESDEEEDITKMGIFLTRSYSPHLPLFPFVYYFIVFIFYFFEMKRYGWFQEGQIETLGLR